MSKLRKRYRVAWDDGEPVEVRTNALDVSVAADHPNDSMRAATSAVHHALEREGHFLPPFEKWLEVLDEFFPLDDQGRIVTAVDGLGEPTAVYEPDPTEPAPGPDEPSPSP